MNLLLKFHRLPFQPFILISLGLGLAPFAPPHIFEKINMLMAGTLTKPIDIFDLVWHGFVPVLLILKCILLIIYKVKKNKGHI